MRISGTRRHPHLGWIKAHPQFPLCLPKLISGRIESRDPPFGDPSGWVTEGQPCPAQRGIHVLLVTALPSEVEAHTISQAPPPKGYSLSPSPPPPKASYSPNHHERPTGIEAFCYISHKVITPPYPPHTTNEPKQTEQFQHRLLSLALCPCENARAWHTL